MKHLSLMKANTYMHTFTFLETNTGSERHAAVRGASAVAVESESK